jgi:hypothetical protein
MNVKGSVGKGAEECFQYNWENVKKIILVAHYCKVG